MEARAKRRTAAALRGAGVAAAADGASRAARTASATCPSRTCAAATRSSCGRASGCPSTARSSTARARWTSRCSPASRCPSRRRPATGSSAAPSTRRARSATAPPRSGADSVLAHIMRLMRDAQATRAPIQQLADRVSAVFVPTVVRHRRADVGRVDGRRRGGRGGARVRRGGGRAHHRVSVRHGARGADRHHGRDGTGRRRWGCSSRAARPSSALVTSPPSSSTRPAR